MMNYQCPVCHTELKIMVKIEHTVQVHLKRGTFFVDTQQVDQVEGYRHTAWFECDVCLQSYEALVDDCGVMSIGQLIEGDMKDSQTHQLIFSTDIELG